MIMRDQELNLQWFSKSNGKDLASKSSDQGKL